MSGPLYRILWKGPTGAMGYGEFCFTYESATELIRELSNGQYMRGYPFQYWVESEYSFRGY
jgi:hypothetical protein